METIQEFFLGQLEKAVTNVGNASYGFRYIKSEKEETYFFQVIHRNFHPLLVGEVTFNPEQLKAVFILKKANYSSYSNAFLISENWLDFMDGQGIEKVLTHFANEVAIVSLKKTLTTDFLKTLS